MLYHRKQHFFKIIEYNVLYKIKLTIETERMLMIVFYEKTKITKDIKNDVFLNFLIEIKDIYSDFNYYINPDFELKMMLKEIEDNEELTNEEKLSKRKEQEDWFKEHISDNTVMNYLGVAVVFNKEDESILVIQEESNPKSLTFGRWISLQYVDHAFESYRGDDSGARYIPEAVLKLNDRKLISLFSEDHFVRFNNKIFIDQDQVFFKEYVKDHVSIEDESDSANNLLKSICEDSSRFDLFKEYKNKNF